jgi:phosphatidylglycerophosphatase A
LSPARFIASGFGVGFAPVAPGTAGSLLALLLGVLLILASPVALPVAALAATLGGVWAIRAARVDGDPSWVVIDEVAGQWIAMLPLPRPAWPGLVAAFLLFRLFDITKPGPVGWADRRHGAVGVMADDVIAGAIAAIILSLFRLFWPHIID